MSKRPNIQIPLGSVAGLLTGSLVTIIGVVVGLSPETVIIRAGIAAIGMAIVGSILSKLLELLMA